MEAGAGKRTLISVLVALIVVVIIYFLVPSTPAKPEGILLPTGVQMKPVQPDGVTLFNVATSPINYKNVGRLNVVLHSPKESREGQTILLQFAQQLAGKAGANGIIANLIGHTPPEIPSSQAVYVFRGTAIYYVPNT